MPSVCLRSMVMLRFPRLQQNAMWLRIQKLSNSPLLTLMTSAPRSASSCVPNGPATASPRSSTTTPSSGEPSDGARSMRSLDTSSCRVNASVTWPARRRPRRGPRRCARRGGRWRGRRTTGRPTARRCGRPTRIVPTSGSSTSITQPSSTQRRVEQRLLGRAHELHRHADLGGEPLPVLGRELRHRRRHLVVEVRAARSCPRGRWRPAWARRAARAARPTAPSVVLLDPRSG